MKLILIATTALVLGVELCAADAVKVRAVDGLYKIHAPDKVTRTIENGHLVMKVPVKRVEILHVVLRSDTEKKDSYWLECHMKKFLDPQGECLFIVDETEVTGFTVRTSEIVPKGSKWALEFTDIEDGRKLLKKVAEIYNLGKTATDDQTSR